MTTPTTDPASELRSALERATPGDWIVDPDDRPGMEWNNHIVSADDPAIRICFMAHDGTDGNARGEANAAFIAAAKTHLPALLAEHDARLARVEALEEVLRPFAKYMDGGLDRDNKGQPLPDDHGVGWVYLTMGDFRRARSVLAKEPAVEGGETRR